MRQQYQTQMPRVQALPLFEADTCPCGFTIASLRAVLKREQRTLSECQASHHECTGDIERRVASINRHLKGSCKPS